MGRAEIKELKELKEVKKEEGMKKNISNVLVFLAVFAMAGCAEKNIILQRQAYQAEDKQPINRKLDKNTCYLSCNKSLTLTCKPLMLTDIALLPNENVLSLNAGDTARWSFQTMTSNTDDLVLNHILLKPKEDSIQTNLIVATNQRTYHLNLVSNENAVTNGIYAFFDPIHQISRQQCQTLDSNYAVKVPFFKTTPSWTPNNVYNDGKSVYIFMPKLNQYSAPTFYVLNDNNEPTVVNYQVNNDYYRVDQLFSKAILVRGVGRNQEKVIIDYLGKL